MSASTPTNSAPAALDSARTPLGAAAVIAPVGATSASGGSPGEALGGERARRIRAMFGDISHAYDLNNHLLSLNTDRRWRRAAVRCALRGREAETRLALDCCTGTGDLALELARRLTAPGARVIGADFCPPMLQRAVTKTVVGAETAFLAGDTMRLPFGDAQFDLATVAFGIRNVADLGEGLAEMARVVRPGGRIVILEFTPLRSPILRWSYRLYFERLLPWIGGMISRRRDAYRYLADSVEAFPDCEGLKEAMERAGWREVRYRRLSLGIAALHWGEKSAGSPENLA